MQFYGISVMRPYKQSGRWQVVLDNQAPFMKVSLPCSLRPEAVPYSDMDNQFNPLKPELNPICYLLALLGAHHFLHVSRIRVKLLTLRRLTSYIYGAPILDVSRSHTTTQHSR